MLGLLPLFIMNCEMATMGSPAVAAMSQEDPDGV